MWQLYLQQDKKPEDVEEKLNSVVTILHKLKVRYPNLQLAMLNLSLAVQGTPYEAVVNSGQLENSGYHVT